MTIEQKHTSFRDILVSADFGPTIGWTIVKGRDFSRAFRTDSTAAIVNEEGPRILGFKDPISWSFLPSSAPVSGSLGEELVVYHCVDEFSAFSDAPAQQIRELERRLLAKADVVICSAEKLRKDKERVNPNAYLVQHGVDLDHFAKAFDARTVVPDEVKSLPGPVIGFALSDAGKLTVNCEPPLPRELAHPAAPTRARAATTTPIRRLIVLQYGWCRRPPAT